VFPLQSLLLGLFRRVLRLPQWLVLPLQSLQLLLRLLFRLVLRLLSQWVGVSWLQAEVSWL